jgi:DNA-directed RNA polymerase subunit alpha|tara:strand:+ start:6328 stop:7305 length:978 start_codon:yes stop_codon:yes gene_type:complete
MSSNNVQLKFKLDKKTRTDSYGSFTLEPLERGAGITVGNAMRRVLLTSIPGVAVNALKIDGVLHEYATLKGVKEDVSDLIQNLKQVRFKLTDPKPDKIQLSFNGKGVFTAKDIDKASDQYEVMNTDLYIATLDNSASFTIELQLTVGKGYVDADSHQRIDSPIGMIFIDSIFNPVKQVSYDVKPVSSAKDSMEKLNLIVTTDGTISAENSVSFASRILSDYFAMFQISDDEPILEIAEDIDEESLRIRELLHRSIDEMELSVRSHNCLKAAGINTIMDLVSKEENQMLKYKNFGRKSLSELIEKLDEMELSFGMDVEKYIIVVEE